MRPFVEESQTLIRAPIQVVWEALIRFDAWPDWSSQIKEVHPVPQGWRFRTHGVELMDQIGVICPKPSSQPYRLEWEAVRDLPHNLITRGSVQLEPAPLGTRLFVYLEAKPEYPSRLMDFLADLWALAFGEPAKFLSTALGDFRFYVERQVPAALERPRPELLGRSPT